MHESEAQRLGIAYSYLLLDFDQLGLADNAIGDVVAAAQSVGFSGLNITHPFKQAIVPMLDRLSPEAGTIGAVNTVVFRNDCVGYNTDSWGFAESFRESMTGAPTQRVAMFGAGGAGAAVAYALMELGVGHLAIVDSDNEKAQSLASRLGAEFRSRVSAHSKAFSAVAEANGVVNATPVGMAKYPGTPFDTSMLTPEKWVADVVYFPAKTELLRRAGAIGCRTLPGIGMAIFQAVRAFELFTGKQADRRAMANHFEAAA
jgi:shikimate dehydrogenase